MPLVKRANSKFWFVQFQLNHRTVVRSTKTTDRHDAEKIEAKLRAEAYAEGVLGKKKSITLDKAVDRFIATKVGTPNHKNLRQHRKALLAVLRPGDMLEQLTDDDLDRYKLVRLGQGRSPQTVRHELNLALGALKSARRAGFEAPSLTSPRIKLPAGRLRYLTIDEEDRFLRELDPARQSNGLADHYLRSSERRRELQDNYDLAVILLDTGARYSEIASLSWEQIDLANSLIRLWRSKVQNESLIFMTARVKTIVANRWERRTTKYLFSNSKGGPRGYSVIALRKAFHRAGLHDCTVHTLRHTHASRLIQNGMTVYEVKSVLGHADIRTTMRYAHLEQAVVTSKARDVMDSLSRT